MHPSLNLQDLSPLPPPVQVIATRAANGSLQDVKYLLHLLEDSSDSQEQLLLLPVFYVNLNPAPDDPAQGGDVVSITNTRAILSLRAMEILRLRIPREAHPDVWPRIWKWYSFLHTYHDSIPQARPEIHICGDLILFVGTLLTYWPKMIPSTVGLRVIITRVWKLSLEAPEGPWGDYHRSLEKIIPGLNMGDRTNLNELIEGAGGSLEDVASLIRDSLDYSLPSKHVELTLDSFYWIEAVFHPLHALMHDAHIRRVLVRAGIVASLIRVICTLANSRIGTMGDILRSALLHLRTTFKDNSEECVLREAVSSGFLRAIISCTLARAERDLTTDLCKKILPLCAVYRSVLSQIRTSLEGLDNLTMHPVFWKSTIFDSWDAFLNLTAQREELVQRSARAVAHRACGQCLRIGPKSLFGRCGGCHTVYYCSSDCQRKDWRHGGHRLRCSSIQTFNIKHQDLTPRNLSFLRALVHDDYETHKAEALYLQLECYRSHPSALALTIFDYSSGWSEIAVRPASELMKTYPSVNWREYLPRAFQSRGRMELHLAIVPTGQSGPRAWLFPLSSNVSLLQDEMRRLATGSNDPVPEIKALLERTRGKIAQIHQ
ncbi:hypothetical protein B0H19DRAFT_714977 [Mycena capillaripes]|nr:hypothetical protein B0H19DRAFT_714977 [Mycena capillaripes]